MKRNAFFQLIHKSDGMYLKSYPAVNGGKALQIDDIMFYLGEKNYNAVPIDSIKTFVEKSLHTKNAEVRISFDKALPEKEFAVISVDKNRLYAKIRLYPNSSEGARLTSRDIVALLGQQGVCHGILQKNIDMMLRARLYCTDVLVAKATMPVHGHDAKITYHFNVDKTNKPEMSEDGQVDFHKLDMIEPVTEGQLLATLEPADFGTPGTDVLGKPIKPKKVSIKKLKHGKHIHLSDDELSMYSDVSGNVTCVDDTVFVSDCYEVPADVGPSTGDIEYDGSVKVKGNVLTGYTVKATGDIYVNGAVEGATLLAGGKIVLNRGIQGMGKAYMEASGDVISNFIESSTVHSGGKIITDALLHSEVIAKDAIEVNGKRGLIAGGSVRSTVEIEAKVLGSTMGTQTELEVGYDPNVIDRYHEIEKIMEERADEKETIEQNIAVLKKRFKAVGTLEPEKLVNLKRNMARVEEIDSEMDTLTEEYEKLDEELENMTGHGKIIVTDIAYSGVKLTISNVTNYLHSEVHHSTFVREGADIRIRGIL
ncbi:MAG: FapA family protein [Butyribacter sp.]|nr:FapA family protein [bacterium]MDY3855237.1 FapA family protein [Butyribacter sp.]